MKIMMIILVFSLSSLHSTLSLAKLKTESGAPQSIYQVEKDNGEVSSLALVTDRTVLCYAGRNCTGAYLGVMFFSLCRNAGKSCDLNGNGRCYNF